MLAFERSIAGKRIGEISQENFPLLFKAYSSFTHIIQSAVTTQEKAAGKIKPTAIINFSDIAKGKSDNKIRALFNQQIQHKGITVVKFSSELFCKPCKAYAPTFENIAEQLKEITVNNKIISVHYITIDTIDTDTVRALAKDCPTIYIPTTIFYKNGKKIDVKAGKIEKDVLIATIKTVATK
jgi:thiol-disulfide isomerase/thioredoxin